MGRGCVGCQACSNNDLLKRDLKDRMGARPKARTPLTESASSVFAANACPAGELFALSSDVDIVNRPSGNTVVLGVDSPSFQPFLFKNSDGFLERRIPGKTGEVSPRIETQQLTCRDALWGAPNILGFDGFAHTSACSSAGAGFGSGNECGCGSKPMGSHFGW